MGRFFVDGLFTEHSVIKDSYYKQDYEDKVLVIKPDWFKPSCRTAENQLFLAIGGFGCDLSKTGGAVFGIFLTDGEETRLDRSDFFGVLDDKYMPDWAKSRLCEIKEKLEQEK